MANYEETVGPIDLKFCFLASGDQYASFGYPQSYARPQDNKIDFSG